MGPRIFLIIFCVAISLRNITAKDSITRADRNTGNSALAELVRMFSKPGAFKQINTLLGENSIEETSTSCPEGEDGLDCRRAEARRSVECPEGDCYCSNCALAGPRLWASCCQQGLRCCSHLAAACRTCDQPTLFPFCAKHFKKCVNHIVQK